jgi:dephospho-CoA kinase
MLRVALTGGVATGKSHVLKLLAARGVPTIDADRLARDAVARGSDGLDAITRRFGPAVLAADGSLDRRAMADIVFRDAAARRDLESIIHPAVYAAIARWIHALEQSGGTAMAVADVPLLYETAHEGDFHRVIVTAAAPDVQVRRMMERDGATETEARSRLAAQLPIEEKSRRADYVIRTDVSFAETEKQVDEAYARLLDEATA